MEPTFLISITIEDLKKLIKQSVKEALTEQDNRENIPVEFLSRKQTAQLLDISLPTLAEWTKDGKIPGYKISSRIRYKRHEIEASMSKIDSNKGAVMQFQNKGISTSFYLKRPECQKSSVYARIHYRNRTFKTYIPFMKVPVHLWDNQSQRLIGTTKGSVEERMNEILYKIEIGIAKMFNSLPESEKTNTPVDELRQMVRSLILQIN